MVIAIGGEMHFASVLRKTKMVDTGDFVDVDRATGVFALRLDTHFYVATNLLNYLFTPSWVVRSIILSTSRSF